MAAPDSWSATDGGQVAPLTLDPQTLLDRCVIIYGPPSSGKTAIAKAIMRAVAGQIRDVALIAPPDSHRDDYNDDRIVRVRTDVFAVENMLRSCVRLQDLTLEGHALAHSADSLRSLLAALPVDCWTDRVSPPNETEKERVAAYRAALEQYVAAFQVPDSLSSDEKLLVSFRNANPHQFLVIDGLSEFPEESRKALKCPDLLQALLECKNRHTTVVICARDVADVPKALRLRADISVFTTWKMWHLYCGRQSNGLWDMPRAQSCGVPDWVFAAGDRKLALVHGVEANGETSNELRYLQLSGAKPGSPVLQAEASTPSVHSIHVGECGALRYTT